MSKSLHELSELARKILSRKTAAAPEVIQEVVDLLADSYARGYDDSTAAWKREA